MFWKCEGLLRLQSHRVVCWQFQRAVRAKPTLNLVAIGASTT
jgi:hypothetical protein